MKSPGLNYTFIKLIQVILEEFTKTDHIAGFIKFT